MDEVRKKRLIQLWLGVLWASLWAVGLVTLLVAAAWLLGLWRQGLFAVVGALVGAYVAFGRPTVVERVTFAVLIVLAGGAGAVFAWMTSGRPDLLIPLAAAAIAFLASLAAVLGTIRFFAWAFSERGGAEQAPDVPLMAVGQHIDEDEQIEAVSER